MLRLSGLLALAGAMRVGPPRARTPGVRPAIHRQAQPLPAKPACPPLSDPAGAGSDNASAARLLLDSLLLADGRREDARQQPALKAILAHFRGQHFGSGGLGSGRTSDGGRREDDLRRALALLPQGFGKTLLALMLTRALAKGEHGARPITAAIYATPFRKLVDQTLEQLDRFNVLEGVPHSRLLVSSATGRGEECTTDPAEIAAAVDAARAAGRLLLVVSTYASLGRVGEALRSVGGGAGEGAATLAIFDEAHTMTGIGKRSGLGLYDEFFPVEWRVFLASA